MLVAHNLSAFILRKLSGFTQRRLGGDMKRTAWLEETRTMRFEEAYTGWQERRLSHYNHTGCLRVLNFCAMSQGIKAVTTRLLLISSTLLLRDRGYVQRGDKTQYNL